MPLLCVWSSDFIMFSIWLQCELNLLFCEERREQQWWLWQAQFVRVIFRFQFRIARSSASSTLGIFPRWFVFGNIWFLVGAQRYGGQTVAKHGRQADIMEYGTGISNSFVVYYFISNSMISAIQASFRSALARTINTFYYICWLRIFMRNPVGIPFNICYDNSNTMYFCNTSAMFIIGSMFDSENKTSV